VRLIVGGLRVCSVRRLRVCSVQLVVLGLLVLGLLANRNTTQQQLLFTFC
jgi:hypothetical protein